MPDIAGSKAELLAFLAANKIARASTLADIEEAMSAARAGLETAGDEYNEQVASAQAGFEAARGEYDAFLEDTDKLIEEAGEATDQITGADATDEIAAIGHVSAPAVTAGVAGEGDVTAASVQFALDLLASGINGVIDAAVLAMEALNSGSVEETKTALTKLKETAEGFRRQMPASEDTEAEKAATHAAIDGLY